MKSEKPNYTIGPYIRLDETLNSAKKENLSICDYLEKIWNQKGATQKVIDNMKANKVFSNKESKIIEIGTGSGRYLEKIINQVSYKEYYSFETIKEWSNFLAKTYKIKSVDTNGYSLEGINDYSIDIIHSHGVFVYLPFLISIRYFYEMFRVCKKDSFVCFDVYDETCFNKEDLSSWLNVADIYPVLTPIDFLINFFKENGYDLINNFYNKHGASKSRYYIFKKTKSFK